MRHTALDIYTAPKRTIYEQHAYFVAKTAADRNPKIKQPREDDVWSILVVLEHVKANDAILTYSRDGLGGFVGLVCQLWALIAQNR